MFGCFYCAREKSKKKKRYSIERNLRKSPLSTFARIVGVPCFYCLLLLAFLLAQLFRIQHILLVTITRWYTIRPSWVCCKADRTHTHTKTETMRIPERWTNETEVISFIWTINKTDTVPVSIIQNCKCEFCPFPLVIIRPLLLGIQSPHHLHKTADFDWNRLWNSSPKKCVREWYIMWYECLKTHYTIYNIFIWFNDDDQESACS